MTKNKTSTKKQRRFGILQKLLCVILPSFFVSFFILLVVNFFTSKETLTDSAIRTLQQESLATVQDITIDMVTATGAPSLNEAYLTIFERPSTLSSIYKNVEYLEVMDCGYAFLVDTATGKVLAHENSSIKNSILFEIQDNTYLEQIAEMVQTIPKQGEIPVKLLNDGSNSYYVIAQPFDDMPWALVSCLPDSYIDDELTAMNMRMIVIIAILLLICTAVVSILILRILAPVKKLTNALVTITDGDFTVNISNSGSDEIAVMSQALEEFITIMREVIADIRDVSNQLSEHSVSAKKVSEELSETSAVQAESMGDMQVTLDQVANGIQELAMHATTLAEVVNTTNTESRNANEKMQTTVDVATKGREDMEQVAATMSAIVSTIRQLENTVAEVGTSTARINSIVQVISEIAAQTNLLSLNAAIEAARAGEAGRGFSVVAEEIRKLAEISSSSATQIADIINTVNTQVSDMVTRTGESVTYIEDNSSRITASCEIFDHIYQDVSSTSDVLQDIVVQIHQVDDVATNIAALSEEQSASTEEILASNQVLAEGSLQVSDDSKQMEEIAETVSAAAFTLAEHMRRFKI